MELRGTWTFSREMQSARGNPTGRDWVNNCSLLLVLHSGINQRAREPAPIIPFATREPEFVAASPIFSVCMQRTATPKFLKDNSVALLTHAFLEPSVKEASCWPSQRKGRCCGSPAAHINPFLHSPSLTL